MLCANSDGGKILITRQEVQYSHLRTWACSVTEASAVTSSHVGKESEGGNKEADIHEMKMTRGYMSHPLWCRNGGH